MIAIYVIIIISIIIVIMNTTHYVCKLIAVLKRQREDDEDSEDEEWMCALYEIRSIATTRIPRFNSEARDYKVGIRAEAFPDDITVEESLSRVYHILKGIIGDLLGHLDDSAHARIVILGGGLETPISTSMQKVRNITPELIITHISDIVQSGKSFMMDHDMKYM
jgi:hypothetical protein